ncbi:pentatricopeptide repeat-containing protein At1g51965, mitochondrial-like [Cryptomeria japonica]|uniref:pentatricopeptide repeat-containing protein At1g51965, mitochondrial-like n=1 Tax=Cryptomeria japonica TaxID=3369 RepID=UPI0027D9D28C|nr:pentatricopeptide repeat-containing protein At1g51965, mitochondrial-like [Cryptomeria japonica]
MKAMGYILSRSKWVTHILVRCHFIIPISLFLITKRSYGTKYSGRVIREDEDGRCIAVQVEASPTLKDIRGYAYPRRDIICRLCHMLKNPDWLSHINDYLDNVGIVLTTVEHSHVLRGEKDCLKALEFFKWAESRRGYKHDCFSYNRMISILGKGKQLEQIRLLVDEMERKNIQGNISTINILIGVFGSKEHIKEAAICCRLAQKWKLKFNAYTYKSLLQAYLRSDDVDKAVQTYRHMRRSGYTLDIFAYNMLLDSLAKADQVGVSQARFSCFLRIHLLHFPF